MGLEKNRISSTADKKRVREFVEQRENKKMEELRKPYRDEIEKSLDKINELVDDAETQIEKKRKTNLYNQ